MTEEELVRDAHHLTGWQKHRFILMIGASIGVALLLVAISMKLYASSGAAQLDLSRPGYEHVSQKTSQSDVFKAFPSSGNIDKKTLDDFKALYHKRANQATNIDSFAGDVMSDQALSIDAPVIPPAQ